MLISLPLALSSKFLAIAAALHEETFQAIFGGTNGPGDGIDCHKKTSTSCTVYNCTCVYHSPHLLCSTMCNDTVFVLFHMQLQFEAHTRKRASAAVYDTYLSRQQRKSTSRKNLPEI